MSMAGAKAKHLEMIQAVVSRMAGNLFFLKGWSITLVAALFALGAKDANPRLTVFAYFPVLLFWSLDGYFLSQERMFRDLYDDVRKKSDPDIDFSMDTSPYRGTPRNSWLSSMFSKTLMLFYMPILAIMLLFMIFMGG